jgi:U-box domain
MTADAPDKFICPISLVVMSHPVRTNTGHVFERKAIMEWVYFGKATCPMSRKPLHPSAIKRDIVLEQEIRRWKLENNMPVDEPEETAEDEEVLEVEVAVPPVLHAQDNSSKLLHLRDRVLRNRERRLAAFGQQRSR